MGLRLKRLVAVIQKEMVQRLRDWPTLVLILAVPVIELFLFAYVGEMMLEDIPTAVADMSKDGRSRALIDALQASGSFDVQIYVENQEEAVHAIDEGWVGAAVVIPPGFGPRGKSTFIPSIPTETRGRPIRYKPFATVVSIMPS